MWLRDIILAHQMKLSDAVERGDNDAQFSCLMFALQLPSMCARLDFPKDKYEQSFIRAGSHMIESFISSGLRRITPCWWKGVAGF